MKKRIIFIANAVYPKDNSGGGSVVIYRHLKRFSEEGHEIVIINSLANSSRDTEFEEISLPKKKWYPPLRKSTPWFTNFRTHYDELRLRSKIKFKENDIVIGILGEHVNLLALSLAQKHGLGLFFIYHDDSLFNIYGYKSILTPQHIKKIFSYTSCVFAVSEQMVELLKRNGAKEVELLYPIPNGNFSDMTKPVWNSKFSEEVKLAFAGLLFDDLHTEILVKTASALHSMNSNLILYTTSSDSGLAKELKQKFNNVLFYPSQSDVRTLFSRFTENASALLVFYSFKKDAEHRMFSSFPSKLLEYMSVGLPILIMAPEESTLGTWAIKNNWPLYVNDDKEELIIKSLTLLKDYKFWCDCTYKCEEIARTVFNPDLIHLEFRKKIFNCK